MVRHRPVHKKDPYIKYHPSGHKVVYLTEPDEETQRLRAEWLVERNKKSKAKRIQLLHQYLQSYVTGGSGSKSDGKHKATSELTRRRRQAQTRGGQQNKRGTVDWESVVSSFRKWDALGENANLSFSFYEERDGEYEAAMSYAYITSFLDPSDVEPAGHVKNDFIASCKFGGYQCSPLNFTYIHSHKYGNCYTFNSAYTDPVPDTKFPGPGNGLRLELFLQQDEYVANLAPEAGARVLIHKKGSHPFPEDEGISVMPGRSTYIGLRQVIYSRLPAPHGQCSNRGLVTDYYSTHLGTTYSKLSCLKSCYQDLITQICHCAAPIYFVFDNDTICNLTDSATEQCVRILPDFFSSQYENCDKQCPLPCTETKYRLSVSSAIWPSEKYKSFLIQRLGQTNNLYRQLNDSENEFTKILIYFEDMIYEHVDQQQAYESMNLISDLGGQLGLWLGLSAITIGELCSCLLSIGRLLSSARCSGKTSPGRVNDVKPIAPATLEEMYEDMYPAAAKYAPPDIVTSQKIQESMA